MSTAAERRIGQLLARPGGIPPAPDGPIVLPGPNQWAELAACIETEAANYGSLGKITLHMDVPDALALAAFLRNAHRPKGFR